MNENPGTKLITLDEFDSPALLIYPPRIKENIRRLLEKIKPENLRPHVKTNKIAEVSDMMLQAGITKFKAATIAEAEMLAINQAPDVLLAYPPTSTKIKRLIRLIQKYPDTKFSCLVDHLENAKTLSDLFSAEIKLEATVYIDLNLGMNRTGILPEYAVALFQIINSIPAIKVLGLHAYDGHIKDPDLKMRTENCHTAFTPVAGIEE